MSRKFKSLGLALMGVLALTAVVASAASAKNVNSNSASGTTYFTAVNENTNQLDLANGSNVKCTKVVYEGSFSGTTAGELTAKPTYSECLSSGQQTTINTGTCNVTLTTPTQTTDTDNYDGKADLVCGAGSSIVVSVGDPVVTCTVTVHGQELKGTVDYTDITTAVANQDDITLLSTLEVAYTASGSVCGTANTGKLTGALTAKGYSNATHTSQVDLWID